MLMGWEISIGSVCTGRATPWGTNNTLQLHTIAAGKGCARSMKMWTHMEGWIVVALPR